MRLRQWAAAVEQSQEFGHQGIDRLTHAITSRQLREIETGMADWSRAALAYDALANLHQARLIATPNSGTELTRALHKLYDDLAAAQRTSAGYLFRSDQLSARFTEIQKQLRPMEDNR
jgi:hypothetical protein